MKRNLSATHTKLASGKPYWPIHSGPLPKAQRLTSDLNCDVAVIGGGITGSLVAHQLTRAGLDVVLLEQNRFACGSTSASTALLSFEYDLLLTDLIEKKGEKLAVRAHELSRQALGELENLVKWVADPCDFGPKTSLRISQTSKQMPKFENEVDVCRKHGFEHRLLDPRALEREFGLLGAVGIASPKAAQIDPFRFARRLIAKSMGQGLRAFERAKVTLYNSGRNCVELQTSAGYRITARKVVFATGYESEKYLERPVGRLNTDFCFVSHPVSRISNLEKCHFVEFADNYIYASTFGNRIMVGMEDRAFRDPKERSHWLVSRSNKLVSRFSEFAPDRQLTPEYRWAATFAKSEDSLPYLIDDKHFPHALFVLGYGGNGIAASAMLAPIVAELVTKGRSKDARLFAWER